MLFDRNFNPKPAFYSIMDFESDAGGNQKPIAVLNADVTSGSAPLTVSFDGSDSYDDDGSIVEYHWTFGDGDTSPGADVTHIYQAPGSYTAQLTVIDDQGGTGTASVDLTVDSDPSNVIFVQDVNISVLAVTSKKNAAQVEVLVLNSFGDPIEGVIVSGMWSGIVSGSISGITDSNGLAAFTSNTTHKSGMITFTVDNLSITDYQYDDSSNLMTSVFVVID
ncbi:MAG: PKD domain-containing protein [Candidatus Electrothrix sp. AUS1_2]|nr:PKD domain-containing protein [Candidatus Electrothrix sp. AUS1_2]